MCEQLYIHYPAYPPPPPQSDANEYLDKMLLNKKINAISKKISIPLLPPQWQGNANYCAGFVVRELSFAFKEYCGVVYVYVYAEKPDYGVLGFCRN